MERSTLEPFQLAQAESVGPRWERWITRFENFLVTTNIEEDGQRRTQLLHLAGGDVFDVFEGLAAQPTTYEEAKEALTTHFSPKRNREFETFRFRSAKQERGDLVDKFAIRSRRLARHRRYTNLESEIKTQVVQSCRLEKVREKAFMEDINLEGLLKYARSVEATTHQLTAMLRAGIVTAEGATAEQVHAVRRGQKGPVGACFYCGEEGHYARDEECPARGQKGSRCGRRGHLEATCRQPKQRPKETGSRSRRAWVNFVEEEGGIDDHAF